MNILVVEDDQEVSEQLARSLRTSGHDVTRAHDGEEGMRIAAEQSFDVMVVDRMMPKLDGLSMIAGLRAAGNDTPVLILSALGQVDDRVTGLRAGGDDYLTKPFAFSELLARIEVLARRNQKADSETVLQVGDLQLDRISHQATRGGQDIGLQPREYRLLEYLMKNAGQIVTRTMLLEHVWNYHFDPQTNVIDVHISRLRAKIDKNFDEPMLHTVRGTGYVLKPGGAE